MIYFLKNANYSGGNIFSYKFVAISTGNFAIFKSDSFSNSRLIQRESVFTKFRRSQTFNPWFSACHGVY